ncbi:calcium permeable stress-gated cation channel 1 isoform X1 [Palaemon carinicauda]|uniref:calcium permeable stress-gated cation channel 1 isoform X1 n=1 Tax=Palaemon carinicauda TaxID=392227 RepID=UPI0035B6A35B
MENDTFPIEFTPQPTVWDPTVEPDYIDDNKLSPDRTKCNTYVLQNKTHLFSGGYEGIPENLLINFMGWIVLMSLFTVLRKKAWNYGRLALVQKYESRSKHLGFSQYNVWTQLFYGKENDMGKIASESDSVSSLEFNVHLDKGLLSWIPALFRIKDKDILEKSGKDAVQYMAFQRHIIIYMMIVCVVSIVIVLPINFQGTLEGGEKEFGHTTLANLDPKSRLLWVHVTLAFLFLPMGILFTRRFSKKLELREATTLTSASRTLMITHVPRRSCHKDTLLRHFQEAYPEIELQDVQFAYNIRSLTAYDKEREVAQNARLYCEAYMKETNKRLEMRPYKCGVICGCCDIFGCPKVDAIEYYLEEENRLSQEVENLKVRALQRPTGVAFVTFDSIANATKVLRDHQTKCDCLKNTPASSVSGELKPHNWIVRVAPAPEDIYWANLSVTTRHWWLKAVSINFVLFVVLFFLTTPAVLINTLDFVHLFAGKLHGVSPVLSEFLPTLLLWTTAALMPVIVSYSDQFMTHWTRSAENHSIMRKTFIFLLFMVIILPSLGLTSAKGFMEWVVKPQNGTFRWECIFLPDNGAFFVNYIITSALIGTTLELIRFPELFMYIVRMGLSRSEAETASVRRAILYEFPFGVQYAWMLLIFAMTIIYSISCPLVTPFGTLYMVLKHLVDKYNIFFAYGPSRINKNIHTTAINCVVVSIVCLQLSLLFFSVVRQGLNKDITIYSIILFCITCLVFITHNAFHWFKDFSPVEYKEFSNGNGGSDSNSIHESDITTMEVACQFVPSVLRDAPSGVESSYNYNGLRTYGTQPLEENGHASDSSPLRNDGASPRPKLTGEPPDLYQDYSQPKMTTVSAEINIPAESQGNIEEEDEETVYTRASPGQPVINISGNHEDNVTVKQPSPTVVTIDGSATVDTSQPTDHSVVRHKTRGKDDTAPTYDV